MTGPLPDGSRGFDVSATVSADDARLAIAQGYSFAMRYVRRDLQHPFDLTAQEVKDILAAGLALGIVQHVAKPGWSPTGDLGTEYGTIAAQEADAAGVPAGVTVFCDLEEVAAAAPADDVAAYCDAWFDAVQAAGYEPGLYVGFGPGLSAKQLGALKFTRYWTAYNCDAIPAPRGACIKQHSAKPADRIEGASFEQHESFDVDTVAADSRGGMVTFVLP